METAKFLKQQVSDRIVAPVFTPEALALLQKKKQGGYIILQANPGYTPGTDEYREVYGMTFMQQRNQVQLTKEHFRKTCTTTTSHDGSDHALSDEAIRDLLVASSIPNPIRLDLQSMA